jgi:2-polyprenyl-3-methyl-5-hydroxy-6-metoxy-1,4-benzoquinol methylase
VSERCPICSCPARKEISDLYDDRYAYPGTYSLIRCTSCKHRFLDAEFSAEALERLYSEHYPRSSFDLDSFTPATEARGFQSWLAGERASAFRWVPRGVRILDIGCGFGETLAYHAARGCDVVGVDADENILRVGERFGLQVRAGLFDPAGFQPESFDYVTLDQVVEHVVDPVAFLSGVASVLKSGGVVAISTPNSHGLGARLFGKRWINWHVPYHLQHFSRRSLRGMAEQSGLRVEYFRTITNSAWLHYQFMHLASRPHMGEASPFWDASRAAKFPRTTELRAISALWKFKVFHLLTRLGDGLGLGDNYVCLLRKG